MERSTVQSCLAAPFTPLKSGTAVRTGPTAVGIRSARINIDTDWNRSNCRTHRGSCRKRHRLRHQQLPFLPPPHRIRIRDNTPGLPGSKSRGEDGRQALVRQQRRFHLLTQQFELTGQTPRNRSIEKSGGEVGGLHRPYPSDGGGLSPSKGAVRGSEPSDPRGPLTEACWLLMPTRV